MAVHYRQVPVGLFSFLLIISISYLMYLVEFIMEAHEKERPYTDGMTGVPFQISIAYGYAVSSENTNLSSEEVIKLADQKMYEKKKEMKTAGCTCVL